MERLKITFNAVNKNIAITGATILATLVLYKILGVAFKIFSERFASRVASKTATKFDDCLCESDVFTHLTLLVFPLALFFLSSTLTVLNTLTKKSAALLTVIVLARFLDSFLRVIADFTERDTVFEGKSYRSYLQLASIFVYVIAFVIALGILSGQSPWVLVSGMTVFASVLLLIFRETILGFVSSVQISSYDLVRLGDWIEVPKYDADGDVVEVTLHMLKVQNFDKTFSYVPTHDLLYSGLKNWRGMRKTGARRIKRSIFLDVSSISFMSDALKESLIEKRLWKLPNDYDNYDSTPFDGEDKNFGGLTNLTAFKYYIEHYLRALSTVNSKLTFMVRQLEQTPTGLPVEIYVFAATSVWTEYEGIQWEIFSHIFAVIPYFSLRCFKYVSEKTLCNNETLGRQS